MRRMVVLGVLGVGAVACGEREPGPSEDEYGARFLWTYGDALDLSVEGCTDDPDFTGIWADLDKELPGASVAYEVADDGSAATVLDCATTDLEGCGVQDDPAIELTVEGHQLTGQGEAARSEVAAGCELVIYATLDVVDGGETATIGTGLQHALEGRCAGIDEQLKGDNGLGIDGCTVVATGEATLDALE